MPRQPAKRNTRTRISAAARRLAIVEATLPLFVEHGFRGVTTKVIAKHAGVSEALLYQHFPSKEALYEAVQDACCNTARNFEEAFGQEAPSTEKLVLILYTMAIIMIEKPAGLPYTDLFPRLIMHSLVDDGVFARQFLERNIGRNWPQIEACISAAVAAGDIDQDGIPDHLRFWLAHHTLACIHMMCMAETPAIDYRLPAPALIDGAMRFILRGLGMSPAAVKRCYNARTLGEKIRRMIEVIAKGPDACSKGD